MVCNVVDPQKSVFGSDTNAVTILSGQGIVARIPEKSKEEIASAILDVISGDLK
jgi:phosphopantothenoylcysteine synthetase/decarboxylase